MGMIRIASRHPFGDKSPPQVRRKGNVEPAVPTEVAERPVRRAESQSVAT
jgi:hypothetical protein